VIGTEATSVLATFVTEQECEQIPEPVMHAARRALDRKSVV